MLATKGFDSRCSCCLAARRVAGLLVGVLVLTALTLLGLGVGAAHAAFPGKNGKIAVHLLNYGETADWVW